MDALQRASGEREEEDETSQRKPNSSGEIEIHEYCLGAVRFLETFTGKKLSEQDCELWVQRLVRYPKWKLEALGEYSGTMTNEVFKYLDNLHRPEQSVRSLPEPSQTQKQKQIAKDFNEHIQTVLSFQGTKEERLRWEMESFKRLDKKYPNLHVWSQVKHENRFEGIR